MTSLQNKTRGAALIIALLILAILLIIVLTFFQASRQEMHIAENYRNATQADLLADGGTAIAIAFLNHDRTVHPTVTSIDHAWKTYFNGAWAAGKPWLRQGGAGAPSLYRPDANVPLFNLDAWTTSYPLFPPGDNLYIPRVEGAGPVPNPNDYNITANPFVLSYPKEDVTNALGPVQVDRFADWDNDEDGLRDSAWIPMAMDKFPDLPAELADGLDNDLDDQIDGTIAGTGAIERALFMYWDEAQGKPMLTTCFPPVDIDGDGTVNDPVPNITIRHNLPDGTFETFILNPNRGSPDVNQRDDDYNLVVNDSGAYAYTIPADANAARLEQAKGYNRVASRYFGQPETRVITFLAEPQCELVGRVAVLIKDENSKVNVNAAGGRNFRDDDSPYVRPSAPAGALRRALWSGASTSEYENRVLPQIGNATSDRIWDFRMGGYAGIGMASMADGYAPYIPPPVPAQPSDAASYLSAALNFDVSLPGFGRVDDNGNALWMAMDGIDNDGDGLIDEGLADLPHWDATLPAPHIAAPNGTMDTDEAWTFEGIDEPQEFQAYRPLRNRDPFGGSNPTFAESDNKDNSADVDADSDPDNAVDEIGELGDRYLRSTDQLKQVQRYQAANYDKSRNLVTVNGTDLNSRFSRYEDGNLRPVPVLSGPKLDYNYATAEQIFNAIYRDWGYVPEVPVPGAPGPMLRVPSGFIPSIDIARFAEGLRREDTAIYAPGGILGGSVTSVVGSAFPAFAPDPALHAAQLAANIRDNRDPNLGRTEATTTIPDDWWANDAQGLPKSGNNAGNITYTQAGFEAIRINEIMARPVRRVEAEMVMDPAAPELNPNAFSDPAGSLDFQVLVSEPGFAAPQWSRTGSVIGDQAYDNSVLAVDDPATPLINETEVSKRMEISVNGVPREVPRMIQFRFAASPGLPSFQPPATGTADEAYMEGARYYLMVNTARLNTGRLEPTVSAPDRLKYVIKYGKANEGIIDDLTQPVPFDPFAVAGGNPQVGFRNMDDPTPGTQSGFVLLPGSETPGMIQGPSNGFYNADEAFTVHIPPLNTTVDPTSGLPNQIYLYVGIWFGDVAPDTPNLSGQPELAVNFFDFSQEPDHEWIEVVNTAQAGNPINIGRWELQVGAEVMALENGLTVGSKLLTVPPDTYIAPGGSLLLGFNKYDPGVGRYGESSLTADPWLSPSSLGSSFYRNGISLARGAYGDLIGTAQAGLLTTEPPIPGMDWSTGLTREDGVFYRPNGGDFVDRDGDGVSEGSSDDALASTTDPDPLLLGVWTKHFDRIVELQSADIEGATSLDSVARLVLGDGIFPNYPEHDGIDNDGDNGVLMSDAVDNDGDGFVDATNEGIDEGRWEYDATAAADAATAGRPYLHRPDGAAPGSYSTALFPYTIFDASSAVTTTDNTLTYIGSPADPPEWKAFAERRWYTPDNVIVTLFTKDGLVADRVTYSERDVINRSTDDIRDATLYGRANADLRRSSFWPDNTMGVDFYRSIERKHPLYNGDLHGLSNRWQATDGAYDDWSPSTSMWVRDNTGELERFADVRYNHAFAGSPLRMNLAQRYLETPSKKWAFDKAREGIRNHTYVSPGDLASLVSFMDARTPLSRADESNLALPFDDVPINYLVPEDPSVQGVILARHPYDNPPFREPGNDDMAAVMSGAAMDPLVLSVGTANFYTIVPQPDGLPPPPAFPALAAWNADNWTGTANTAPQAWAPVFLFPIADSVPFPLDINRVAPNSYTMNPLENYLFTGPYGAALPNPAAFPVPAADLAARWQLKLRTVMYASQNIAGFDRNKPHDDPTIPNPAATALFEWTGSNGLENGDYDVYILTGDNLAPVDAADVASRTVLGVESSGRYLTQFGRELVKSASATKAQDMVFDVEMFTDRNYTGAAPDLAPLGPNGHCWIGSYPDMNNLERAGTNSFNMQGDSFGMLLSKSPDADGIMYYGTVRVENNYLALLLRNWTSNGKLARFSRVILTPHPRTTGRLNINTVESVSVDGDPFNALMGAAGILCNPDGTYFAESDIGPSDVPYQNAMLLSNQVVGNRERWFDIDLNQAVRAHADGRYYVNPSDLVSPNTYEGYPNILTQLPVANQPDVFDEIAGRYSRLANLVTTRSDVFEITVTAQTGYLSSEDLNGDGRFDYRNDFIVTGEKKIRTVYER